MRMRHGAGRRERGAALVLLLVALILAGTYALYRGASQSGARAERDARFAQALALAKDALIARAVTDANRPGSLPCPDLVTNSTGLANIPGDGKADFFIGAATAQCPSYVGWLPWVTLDLPELTDDSSTRLWYVLTPELRDDDSAQPINADTAFGLRLDGNADIAALIIAAGPPLAGQNRPSNNPADYLDGSNGGAYDGDYVSGPFGPGFNDKVVAITRRELMAAVGKRVASEVKACLEQHAGSTTTGNTFPWPAPFSSTAQRGLAGSLFGQVPAKQPGGGSGSGPESLLKSSTTALATARDAIGSATSASDQMSALVQATEVVSYAQSLYNMLYVVALDLATVAGSTEVAFSGDSSGRDGLILDITQAVTDGRITLGELGPLRTDAASAKTSAKALQTRLADSGIDVFTVALRTFNSQLQQDSSNASTSPTSSTLGQLRDQATSIVSLLAHSTTPNPDITSAINLARSAANAAQAAAVNAAQTAASVTLTPEDPIVVSAISSTKTLAATISALHDTVQPISNLNADTIQLAALEISTALADYTAEKAASKAAAIVIKLRELDALVQRLSSPSTIVSSQRDSVSAAVAIAISAALDTTNPAAILTSTSDVLAKTHQLARTLAGSRTNLLAAEFSSEAMRTAFLLAEFNTSPSPERLPALATGLASLQALTNRLATNSSLIVAARSAALASVGQALAATEAARDFPAIDAFTNAAIADANKLAAAIAGNGDNVTRESLAVAVAGYETAQLSFGALNPAITRPRARVSFAVALQAPASDIAYWATLITDIATDIATRARRAPGATVDSTTSAYAAARSLLDSIGATGGSKAALQAYIDSPGNATKQAAASTALAATQGQLDELIAKAGAIDAVLDSGTAEALPTVWYGSACTFLQLETGSSTWWSANQWTATTFYQISSRTRSLPTSSPCVGTLRINSTGTYCVVVINAGPALPERPPEPRQDRTVRDNVAKFFEPPYSLGPPTVISNAHPSRNGTAINPDRSFISQPASADFNDRLSN